MSVEESTSTPNHWQDISPEQWWTQESIFSQRCGLCGEEMQGTIITRQRGAYEHFECAKTKYFEALSLAGRSMQLKQNDMVAAVKSYPGRDVIVRYEPGENSRLGRFTVVTPG